jgi:aspartate dehydrogenase
VPNASTKPELRVAIAGLGTIGRALASRLDQGIPGVRLSAVAVRDPASSRPFLAALSRSVDVVTLEDLPRVADIIVECAPAKLLYNIARPALANGKTLVVLSAAGLLEHPALFDLAKKHHAQIVVPTGALIGLDAVTAAAEGEIRSVRMVTRKPVDGLIGAPFLAERQLDIRNITSPVRIFAGTAREAAKGFPANLNVAVALSLAGIGPDRTVLEIWADPGIKRNTHTIEVDSDAAIFRMTIENIPSENPKTGRITAQSVIALLRRMNAPLRVGT